MAGYSIDLTTISLSEFADTLLTVELLPSRRMLADHIVAVTPRLEDKGVGDLAQLRKLLAKKANYPDLAGELHVDVEYLTVLNREVNSYVSKPVPLAKLEYLDDEELASLDSLGVRSTKDLYEQGVRRQERSLMAEQSAVGRDRLDRALRLANLVRVNGVGRAFAEFLLEAGITGPADFLDRDLERMVDEYAAAVGDDAPKLRIEDLEYVQRYCRGLAEDIEW